jgi:hypothetical protein
MTDRLAKAGMDQNNAIEAILCSPQYYAP